MAYFAPYIDGTGLHMPTYEDRLEELKENYRTIFGTEAELSAAVPDYQLLSVFAKALDDVSALTLQAYNSRNPMYASGGALDLLLPQYGLVRASGETDASVRSRIRRATAARGTGLCDSLVAALKGQPGVEFCKVYENDTGSTDARGIPGHSIAVLVNEYDDRLAKVIFDHKPPGIGTHGSRSVTVTDSAGVAHTVKYGLFSRKYCTLNVTIKRLAGCDEERIKATCMPPLYDFIDALDIAEPLVIGQLYGIIYNADPTIAQTFAVSDLQGARMGDASYVRTTLPVDWNQKLVSVTNGITFEFVN